MTARTAITLAATLAASLVAGPMLAQTNIGVVDFDRVILESKRGRAAFAEVEAFRIAQQGEIQGLVESYQNTAQALQNDASLSDAEKRQKQQELQNLQTQIRRSREDAERQGQSKTNVVLGELDKELGPLVRKIAQEKDLHLILQANAELGIVYAAASLDITEEVIAQFDRATP